MNALRYSSLIFGSSRSADKGKATSVKGPCPHSSFMISSCGSNGKAVANAGESECETLDVVASAFVWIAGVDRREMDIKRYSIEIDSLG